MSKHHPNFDPDDLFAKWSTNPISPTSSLPFASAVKSSFSLPNSDTYIYHAAPTSLSLSQAQSAVNAGRANNLHAWYTDAESGEPIDTPPQTDIDAYIKYFDSTTTPDKALKALAANAKKGSMRASVAKHLQSLRLLPLEGADFKIARNKNFVNPAWDFWAWSCKELEWGGPVGDEAANHNGGGEGKGVNVAEQFWVKMAPQSHHVLPILMHHFGCVTPTWEAVSLLTHAAAGRPVYDIGSGNGYWSYVLRRQGLDIIPVDDGQSEWRTMWVRDTVKEDGAAFLRKRAGGREGILLLVYPVTAGEFVEGVVGAYEGEVVCVAGTMNRSGYTGFREKKVGEWMKEKGWKLQARVPLPSFAGKDEGLEVFTKEKKG